jgi:hypothetical protein
MISDVLRTLLDILPGALAGGALLVACAVLGWWSSSSRRGLLVRCTSFWFDHVVSRVLAARSWTSRALLIAANNSLVCAGLVLLGALGWVVWIGIVATGLALGTALRLLAESDHFDLTEVAPQPTGRRLALIGIALNLLEPPAILVSVGLGLAQVAAGGTPDLRSASVVFAGVVLPLLLLSAGGEALWMGIYRVGAGRVGSADRSEEDEATREPDESAR